MTAEDFMINYNESDLRCPEIEHMSPDLQSNALPIELTGRLGSSGSLTAKLL
jgi:hypothetical protein